MAGIKYIFFDLDGTLTNPAEGITNSVAHALKYYGISVSDKTQLYKFIGPPLAQSFSEFYGFSPEKAKEAVEKYREYFADTGIFENKVYDYIPEVLENLKKAGFSLAMATSKPEVFAKRIADKFDLTQYFDFIGGSLLDNSRTDKGEVIEYVLSSLKADREKTIMVGDRSHDILGAKKCGVLSVGVLYGFGSLAELKEAGADYIAETPKKLEELLMAI